MKKKRKQLFSVEEVKKLWQYQFGPWRDSFNFDGPSDLPYRFHPYTCGNRNKGEHPMVAGDYGVLIPTIYGWICPFCDYTQDWAHNFTTGRKDNVSSSKPV